MHRIAAIAVLVALLLHPGNDVGLVDFVRLDQITETARYWRPERISGMTEFFAEDGAQVVTAPQPFAATLTREVYRLADGATYQVSVDILPGAGIARLEVNGVASEWTSGGGWQTLTLTFAAAEYVNRVVLYAGGNETEVTFRDLQLKRYTEGFSVYLPMVQ